MWDLFLLVLGGVIGAVIMWFVIMLMLASAWGR